MIRPPVYRYWDQLLKHIGTSDRIFDGEMTWPRQLELHLPGDHKKPCNFDCFYCAGHRFIKDIGTFEGDALDLLRKLDGNIPYVIYGGSYTEPLLNPYFMAFLNMTKRTGCHFGIHTNGSLLNRLENDQGWLTELARIATDKIDYLSVSLDAGTTVSHDKIKGLQHNWFSEIISGIRLATEISDDKPAIRVCYLMNPTNSSQKEIDRVVRFVKSTDADSLRFSIPFAHYAQSFDKVLEYSRDVEQKLKGPYLKKIEKYLSKEPDEAPFIFWMSPDLQNINLFNFHQCAYGYYQICIGADGYVYRCTTISTPTFKHLRLGPVTSDLDMFKEMIKRNQVPEFDADICFKGGARCNRMGLEINRAWDELK